MRIVDNFFRWVGAGDDIPPKESLTTPKDQVQPEALPSEGGISVSRQILIDNAEKLSHETSLPRVLKEQTQRVLNIEGDITDSSDMIRALFRRIAAEDKE